MSKLSYVAAVLVVLGMGAVLVGCSGQSSTKPQTSSEHPATSPEHSMAKQSDQESGQGAQEDHASHSQYEEALASLSPEDRALVAKQKTCPVSGEPLGAMGTPYKVTVQGRDVFLCCPGCESKFKANPDEYLAKLPK